MFTLVTLGTKYVWFLGSILIAARIATGAGGTTGVNGGAIMVPDFTTAGVASRTAKVPVQEHVISFVRGTGSTTIKYPGACFLNPLPSMSKGSGTLMRLTLHVGNNPAGVGGDIGFVKGCGDAFGSGSTVIDNTCTATGCVSHYTTGTAPFNSVDYIKFTPRANLTSGFTGRITATVEDVWGE